MGVKMNERVVKRGYVNTDIIEFSMESLVKLKKAQQELYWLLDRGYTMKNASTFVGNHYLLSERQRLALVRSTADSHTLLLRKNKCITSGIENQTVYIDALNIIITLEVALSESTLLYCMDGTIRDLAGLRGTYHLIDKTITAIHLIGEILHAMQVKEAIFYLDSPVSNTGRLKHAILQMLSVYPYQVSAELVYNADDILEEQAYVITSDSIILNKCTSWVNLTRDIIENYIPDIKLIDFSLVN